jgi:hypothetical protein
MNLSKWSIALSMWGLLLATGIGIGKNLSKEQTEEEYCNHVLVRVEKQIGDLIAGHCIGLQTWQDVAFIPAPEEIHSTLLETEELKNLPHASVTSQNLLWKKAYIQWVLPDVKADKLLTLKIEWSITQSKEADIARGDTGIYLDVRNQNIELTLDEEGNTELSGLSGSWVYTEDGGLIGIMTQVGWIPIKPNKLRLTHITFAWPEAIRLSLKQKIQT